MTLLQSLLMLTEETSNVGSGIPLIVKGVFLFVAGGVGLYYVFKGLPAALARGREVDAARKAARCKKED